MVIPQKYECEICGKEFDRPSAVRDEIAILNGADSRAYAYVCEKCIKEVVNMLDDVFPKSKYAVRRKDAARIAESVRKTVEA